MEPVDLPNLNQDQFTIVESLVGGDPCFLVTPKKNFYGWTRDLLKFRSSIWNDRGEPVSLSFKKFFNWDERPELGYTPFSMTANGGVNVMEKLDGSTLILSRYKGQTILRSRGTFDASMLPNGYELQVLKSKYPKVFEFFNNVETHPQSWIFEWCSPTNQIVMPFQEPDMYLLSIVNHKDYSLVRQPIVDCVAIDFDLKRPKRFEFKKVKEMVEHIGQQRDFEGVCVYCNSDQEIRKLKTEWYLKMHHALTEELGSFERVVDLYFNLGMPPTYNEFFDAITNYRDFEVATYLKGDISRVITGMKEVYHYVVQLKKAADEIQSTTKGDRRKAAEVVFQRWGKTNRAGMVFTLLDGKPLDADSYKKLLYQILKK